MARTTRQNLPFAAALTVIGKPSAALSTKLEMEEKERLDQRRTELGEEKLKELEKAVEEAKKESEIPPPESMISTSRLPT